MAYEVDVDECELVTIALTKQEYGQKQGKRPHVEGYRVSGLLCFHV